MAIKTATSSFDEFTPASGNVWIGTVSGSATRVAFTAVDNTELAKFTINATVEFYGSSASGKSGNNTLIAVGTVQSKGSNRVNFEIQTLSQKEALDTEYKDISLDTAQLEIESPWEVDDTNGALLHYVYDGANYLGAVASVTEGSNTFEVQLRPKGAPLAIPAGANVTVNGIFKGTVYYIYDDLT